MRVAELDSLRTGDLVVRLRKNFLQVRWKGDLDRLVPFIEPSVWRRLQRFVRGRPAGVASDRLFLGLKGRAGHDELLPLTASGVPANGALGGSRGRETRPSSSFRYSAATWMRTKGLDPLTIARVVGWTSLRMLQRIYNQASPKDDFDAMASRLGTVDD